MTDLSASFFGASMTPMHMGIPQEEETQTPTGSSTSTNVNLARTVADLHELAGLKENSTGSHTVLDHSQEIIEHIGYRQVNSSARITRFDEINDDSFGVPHWEMEILPSLPQGRELVGGWFDPNDVPSAVRDHL